MAKLNRRLNNIRNELVAIAVEKYPDLTQEELSIIFARSRQQISLVLLENKAEQESK